MNAFTAHDLQAADLLVPALPGYDGQRFPPETSGGNGAAGGSPGRHPPVTASRAEMIAASSGRARQQRTPALTGVG
jgi:hypothetical protein